MNYPTFWILYQVDCVYIMCSCLLQLYLFATDKSCDSAAYMLAKFLTRPDVKQKKLPEVMDWAFGILQECCGKYYRKPTYNSRG